MSGSIEDPKLLYHAARIRSAVLHLRSLSEDARTPYYIIFAQELARAVTLKETKHLDANKIPKVINSAQKALEHARNGLERNGWQFDVFDIDVGAPGDVAYDGDLGPDMWWKDIIIPELPLDDYLPFHLDDFILRDRGQRSTSERSKSPIPVKHVAFRNFDPPAPSVSRPSSEEHHVPEMQRLQVAPEIATKLERVEPEMPSAVTPKKRKREQSAGVHEQGDLSPRRLGDSEIDKDLPPEAIIAEVRKPGSNSVKRYLVGTRSSPRSRAQCATCRHAGNVPCLIGARNVCTLCSLRRGKCLPYTALSEEAVSPHVQKEARPSLPSPPLTDGDQQKPASPQESALHSPTLTQILDLSDVATMPDATVKYVPPTLCPTELPPQAMLQSSSAPVGAKNPVGKRHRKSFGLFGPVARGGASSPKRSPTRDGFFPRRLTSHDDPANFPPDIVTVDVKKAGRDAGFNSYIVGRLSSPRNKVKCITCHDVDALCFRGPRNACTLCSLRKSNCLPYEEATPPTAAEISGEPDASSKEPTVPATLPLPVGDDQILDHGFDTLPAPFSQGSGLSTQPQEPPMHEPEFIPARRLEDDEDEKGFPPDIVIAKIKKSGVAPGFNRYLVGKLSAKRHKDQCMACHDAKVPCFVGPRSGCVLCSVRRSRCLPYTPYTYTGVPSVPAGEEQATGTAPHAAIAASEPPPQQINAVQPSGISTNGESSTAVNAPSGSAWTPSTPILSQTSRASPTPALAYPEVEVMDDVDELQSSGDEHAGQEDAMDDTQPPAAIVASAAPELGRGPDTAEQPQATMPAVSLADMSMDQLDSMINDKVEARVKARMLEQQKIMVAQFRNAMITSFTRVLDVFLSGV